MRPSPAQLDRVAETLVRRLLSQELIEQPGPETKIKERFAALLEANFAQEAAIEAEARAQAEKLVRQGAPGIRREDLDLRRVEQLMKQKIAKDRGFSL